jgi:hypothetical protein
MELPPPFWDSWEAYLEEDKMSEFRIQKPVQHIPSIPRFNITRYQLLSKLQPLGVKPYGNPFYTRIWYTDHESWGKVLYDLVFNSNLYKVGIFTCLNYSLKAFNECAERHSLNGLLTVFGKTDAGYHAFNMFYDGNDFMLWEPNEGFEWSGQAFKIGDNNYIPDVVLV